MAGQIFVDGKKILKSGDFIQENLEITIKNLAPKWVSRGAYKILHALKYFDIQVENLTCLDLGASTGGFSDVLLSEKVKKIYAVDVGTNQLHEKLKKQKKILNISKTNARYLDSTIIPEIIDLIVCDVSFISMKKVIKPCLQFLNKKKGKIIGLIKPQFESSKKQIQKGGVILDENIHKKICKEYEEWFTSECQMSVKGIIPSPIKGPKGNIEFLIYVTINL